MNDENKRKLLSNQNPTEFQPSIAEGMISNKNVKLAQFSYNFIPPPQNLEYHIR